MKACFALAAASGAPSLSLSLLIQPSARVDAYAAQAPCNRMPSPLAILSFLLLKLFYYTEFRYKWTAWGMLQISLQGNKSNHWGGGGGSRVVGIRMQYIFNDEC